MLVEGVGDEVLLCLVVLICGCWFFLVLVKVLKYRARPVILHPDSADPVAAVRRERGRPSDAASSSDADPNPASTSGVQDTRCPVCLDPDMQHGVQTNCGHRFCAGCILQYWRLDQWPHPARCPVCRRQVNLLLPLAGDNSSLPDSVQRDVLDYNQRMSGEWRPLLHYLYDTPILLRHLWEELWSVRGPRLFWRLYLGYLAAAMILYILSPLDIVPESVFGLLGLLDDLIFMIILFLYVSHAYRMLHTHR